MTVAPLNGNPNGINTVPVNYAVNTPNRSFFWVLRFPNQATTPGFPNNFPFVRMDFTALDKGLYAASHSVTLAERRACWSTGTSRRRWSVSSPMRRTRRSSRAPGSAATAGRPRRSSPS